MRSSSAIAAILVLAGVAGIASASPVLRDIPSGFWAAGAVHRVVRAGLMSPDANGNFDGSRPVTRYELAVVLDRLVQQMDAARKPLSSLPQHAILLPTTTPAPAAAALRRLIGQGYLPIDTPLVKSPGSEPVTAAQVANVLADVTIGISSRSLPANPN